MQFGLSKDRHEYLFVNNLESTGRSDELNALYGMRCILIDEDVDDYGFPRCTVAYCAECYDTFVDALASRDSRLSREDLDARICGEWFGSENSCDNDIDNIYDFDISLSLTSKETLDRVVEYHGLDKNHKGVKFLDSMLSECGGFYLVMSEQLRNLKPSNKSGSDLLRKIVTDQMKFVFDGTGWASSTVMQAMGDEFVDVVTNCEQFDKEGYSCNLD